MARGLQRFEKAARGRGISLEVLTFPEGTKTAGEAARAVGCEAAQIVKSLVFMGDGHPFLALTSGANQADTTRLAGLLGVREVRRASPEEARAATGFGIGGTPPFGHPRPLRVFVDQDLLSYPIVWAAAGTPDSVFSITPDDLLSATGAEPADFKRR